MRPFAIFLGLRSRVENEPRLFFLPFTTSTPKDVADASRSPTQLSDPARLPSPFSLGPYVFSSKTTSRLTFNTGDITIERVPSSSGSWAFKLCRKGSQVVIDAKEPLVLYDLVKHKFEPWRSSCCGQFRHSMPTSTVKQSVPYVPQGPIPIASISIMVPEETATEFNECTCSLLPKRRRQILGLSAQMIALVFNEMWDEGLNLSDETRLGLRQFLMLTKSSARSQEDIMALLAQVLPACREKLNTSKVAKQRGSFASMRLSEQALVTLSVLCLAVSGMTMMRGIGLALPQPCVISAAKNAAPNFGFHHQPFPMLLHVDSIASARTVTSLGSPSELGDDGRARPATTPTDGDSQGSPCRDADIRGAESMSSKASRWTSTLSPLSLTSMPGRVGQSVTSPGPSHPHKLENFDPHRGALSDDDSLSSPLVFDIEEDEEETEA